MRKVTLFLLLSLIVLSVPAKKIAEFDDIFNLSYFDVTGDKLYVVDEKIVKLFSIKEQKLIGQIGKRGEGPGEYKGFPLFEIDQNLIVIHDYTKVLLFKWDGTYVKEIKKSWNHKVNVVGENFLVKENNFDMKNRTSVYKVWVANNSFEKIKDLYSYKRNLPAIPDKRKEMVFDRKIFGEIKIAITNAAHIYVYDQNKDFCIEIMNKMGDTVYSIKKSTKPEKITDEFKRNYIAFMESQMPKVNDGISFDWNYVFSEHIPPIAYMSVKGDNIYITSYDKSGKYKKLSMLDKKGNVLKTGTIPLKYKSAMDEDKIYYFIDNEDEEVWELHVEDL